MRSHLSIAATIAITVSGQAAFGQSINIDFGNGKSAPAPEYGAAGLSGVWNTVSEAGVLTPLVGLDGAETTATLMTKYAPNTLFWDNSDTADDDANLFNDFLPGMGDIAISVGFSDLQNGTYQVITYAWVPESSEPNSGVFINDIYEEGQTVGGPWPGKLTQGVTHAIHTVEVTNGGFSIGLVGATLWTSGVINGIQLVMVEPAAPPPVLAADITSDGRVDVDDLLILLANWSDGHGCDGVDPCKGDLNHDDMVGVDDLLILLNNWTN